MHIEVIAFEGDQLVELLVGDDAYSGGRVPLTELPKAERDWFARLARAAQAGDARSISLLLEAAQGIVLLDADSRGLSKKGGDSPA